MKREFVLRVSFLSALVLALTLLFFYFSARVTNSIKIDNYSKTYSIEVNGTINNWKLYQQVSSFGIFKNNGVYEWTGVAYEQRSINKLVIRLVDDKQSMGFMTAEKGGPIVATSLFSTQGSIGYLDVNFDSAVLETLKSLDKQKILNEEIFSGLIMAAKIKDSDYNDFSQRILQKMYLDKTGSDLFFRFK